MIRGIKEIGKEKNPEKLDVGNCKHIEKNIKIWFKLKNWIFLKIDIEKDIVEII